jgi:hypothetical protein
MVGDVIIFDDEISMLRNVLLGERSRSVCVVGRLNSNGEVERREYSAKNTPPRKSHRSHLPLCKLHVAKPATSVIRILFLTLESPRTVANTTIDP